jgi:hypothetical protein
MFAGMYSPALDEGYGTATRPMPSASDRPGRINQDGPKTKGAFPDHMVTVVAYGTDRRNDAPQGRNGIAEKRPPDADSCAPFRKKRPAVILFVRPLDSA